MVAQRKIAQITKDNLRLNDMFAKPIAANALEIANGIPISDFLKITDMFPEYLGKIIASATLARRKKEGFVKSNEAEIAIRLLRIKNMAIEVFSDETLARQFLNINHPMLEMKTPIEMALQGESGGKVVENLLGRIAAGVAA